MLVLLVEDEPGIREGLAAYLALKGIVVHAVASVPEALAALERHRYDAVVTDWRLGDDTGAPVLAAADTRAVVMSGYPDEVEAGCAEVLRKPVHPRDLVELLARFECDKSLSGSGLQPHEGASPEPPPGREGPGCAREATAPGAVLPMRTEAAGPRLPRVLRELWRQA